MFWFPTTTPFYKIASVGKEPLEGITEPLPCTLRGIAKFDSPESPHCVYNEYVAMRLGRLLSVPLADGVLTRIGKEVSYVSLHLAAQKPLLQPLASQYPKIASRYRFEAAALLGFDMLIGNYDRYSNFLVSLVHHHILRAFDHSQALLTLCYDPEKSIRRLATDDLIVGQHPFAGLVHYTDLQAWAMRVKLHVKGILIRGCCTMGRPFNAVTLEMQRDLADALEKRAQRLPYIIKAHRDELCTEENPEEAFEL